MDNLDGLHQDAKRRFDELGLELLRSVVTFRETERELRRSFEPNIFKARTVTDQDITGDLHIGWLDRAGEPVGVAVAEIGGTRTGLIGEGVKKLRVLAGAMAKVTPFASTASIEFLQTQIFE